MEEVLEKEIINDEICLIKLNRPQALNSLNKTIVDALSNTISECEGKKSNNWNYTILIQTTKLINFNKKINNWKMKSP